MWGKQMVRRVGDVQERDLIEGMLRCEIMSSKSSTGRSSTPVR